MYAQNLVTTFPFYERDEDCTHNRHWCRDKHLFVQPCPLTRLPTFIIKTTGVTGTVTIWVHNRTTDSWGDITALVTTATPTVGSDTYLVYNWTDISAVTDFTVYDTKGGLTSGDMNWTNFSKNCAELQMVIDKGSTTYYSELFHVNSSLSADGTSATPDDISGCILLDFADDVQVGDIPYSGITFAQRVFLPCDIGRPSYENTLDGPEDGNRLQTPSFRRSIKRWNAVLLLPEYMTDALALMGIHSVITVSDQYAVQTSVDDVGLTTEWQPGGHLALTTIAFRRGFTRKYNC